MMDPVWMCHVYEMSSKTPDKVSKTSNKVERLHIRSFYRRCKPMCGSSLIGQRRNEEKGDESWCGTCPPTNYLTHKLLVPLPVLLWESVVPSFVVFYGCQLS